MEENFEKVRDALASVGVTRALVVQVHLKGGSTIHTISLTPLEAWGIAMMIYRNAVCNILNGFRPPQAPPKKRTKKR